LLKNSHPNHILFYRLGGFYELFFQDALIVSKALDIVLNKKKIGGKYVESCGVPARSLEAYSKKLLNLGFKVAIADQFLDESLKNADKGKNKEAKFIRKITKILTPGTFFEESETSSSQNYEDSILLAVVFKPNESQLASKENQLDL